MYSSGKASFFENSMAVSVNESLAAYSIQGDRSVQQDSFALEDSIPEFFYLSEQEREQVLSTVIAKINSDVVSSSLLGGSTLSAVFCWADQRFMYYCVVNLGDSMTYIVKTLGAGGGYAVVSPSSRHSTDPDINLAEYYQIIRATNGSQPVLRSSRCREDFRLSSKRGEGFPRINVSRVIGDEDYNHYDFFHKPDFFHGRRRFAESDGIYAVAATDGIELLDADSVQRAKQVARFFTKTAGSVSEVLVDLVACAYGLSRPLSDNITAAAVRVRHGMSPVSLLVADGHGEDGDKIAQYITNNFYVFLKKELKMIADKNQQQRVALLEYLSMDKILVSELKVKISALLNNPEALIEDGLSSELLPFLSSEQAKALVRAFEKKLSILLERWFEDLSVLLGVLESIMTDAIKSDFNELLICFDPLMSKLKDCQATQDFYIQSSYYFASYSDDCEFDLTSPQFCELMHGVEQCIELLGKTLLVAPSTPAYSVALSNIDSFYRLKSQPRSRDSMIAEVVHEDSEGVVNPTYPR